MHTLLVYGTLLPGLCRHDAMRGARWLGKARIEARLYDLGPYPGVVPGAGQVWGQVAQVDEALLARLDAIEEFDPAHPDRSEYVRQRFMAQLVVGAEVRPQEAWVYVYNRDVHQATHVPHGDYMRHLQETGYTPTLDVNPQPRF